jgi:hypothetical protein
MGGERIRTKASLREVMGAVKSKCFSANPLSNIANIYILEL